MRDTPTRRALIVGTLGPVLLGACGGGGTEAETAPPPPAAPLAITQQPASVSVIESASVTFAVGVNRNDGVSFQWSRDQVELAGATQPSYTVDAAWLRDHGVRFSVTVKAGATVLVSESAVLQVRRFDYTVLAGKEYLGSGPVPPEPVGFRSGRYIAVDHLFNIYVADSKAVTRIGADGAVVIFAGQPGSAQGASDGLGAAARFGAICGLGYDRVRQLLVVGDTGAGIREVTLAGNVSTRDVGTVEFQAPLAVADDGTIYVATGLAARYPDPSSASAIFRIPVGGSAAVFAGRPDLPGSAVGVGTDARFLGISGLAIDRGGNVFAADEAQLRKITVAGVVSNVVRSSRGLLAVDDQDNVFVYAGPYIQRVRADDSLIGMGGLRNRYAHIQGMACDATGRLYINEGFFVARFERFSTTPLGVNLGRTPDAAP